MRLMRLTLLNSTIIGTRIGRLKVIFHLPDLLYGLHEAPATWPREPLAYIEWYSKLKGESEPDHNMYSVVSSKRRKEGLPYADFVPLSSIRQSCQLIPAFGTGDVPQEWTGKNVLDVCNKFYLNNWSSKYAYKSLY